MKSGQLAQIIGFFSVLFGLLSVMSSSQVWGGINAYALLVGLYFTVLGILVIIKVRNRDFKEKIFVILLFVVYCIYEVFSITMLFNPSVFNIMVFVSAQVFFLIPFILSLVYFKKVKIDMQDRAKYGESKDMFSAIRKIKEEKSEEENK